MLQNDLEKQLKEIELNLKTNQILYYWKVLEKIEMQLKKQKLQNNIYVYGGKFSYNNLSDLDHSFYEVEVQENSEYYFWKEYFNIESDDDSQRKVQIAKHVVSDFENENKILYPPNNKDKNAFYDEVRKMFLSNVSLYGREEAIKRIKKIDSDGKCGRKRRNLKK